MEEYKIVRTTTRNLLNKKKPRSARKSNGRNTEINKNTRAYYRAIANMKTRYQPT